MFLPHPDGRSRHRDQRSGFTLVEIMVVVTIISLLSAVALPRSKKATQSAKGSAIANDLRIFSAAFGTYSQQNSAYPPEVAAGIMPPAMVGALNNSFVRNTPIGGKYNWDNARAHGSLTPRAAVSINSVGANLVSSDVVQLRIIDRRIDDGNLATGNFFLGAGNEPVYILER